MAYNHVSDDNQVMYSIYSTYNDNSKHSRSFCFLNYENPPRNEHFRAEFVEGSWTGLLCITVVRPAHSSVAYHRCTPRLQAYEVPCLKYSILICYFIYTIIIGEL